jgi:hypothetical protein
MCRRRFRWLVAVTVSTAPAYAAEAQTCDGRASFNFSPTHVEARTALRAGGRHLGLAAAHGRDELFAIASLATRSFGGERSHVIAATIGANQPVRLDNRLHVCPTVSVGYVSNVRSGAENPGRAAAAADVRLGWLAANTARLAVIPTLGVGVGFNGLDTAVAASDARKSARLSAGVGMVFRNRVSLVPGISVAVAGASGGAALRVDAAYNLPR